MQASLVNRMSASVPRYTSYPTANHFTAAVDHRTFAGWLAALDAATRLSLYVHVPFCRSLCWYCACSTKMTRRMEPVTAYVDVLAQEIAAVAQHVSAGHRVSHIHWGGGSPSLLAPHLIRRLASDLKSAFQWTENAEFAVEIDPRDLDDPRADAFADAGVTRVSLGVQDFEPAVQSAINREQSFDLTRRAISAMRDRGVASVNIDLVYGLPCQTEGSVARTVERVLSLAPDRLAVFGYAHLPQRVRHQRLIDEAVLPDAAARFAQARRIATGLTSAGYREVGLDHYARAGDRLADGPVKRNFQGYTTDDAATLIGLGATAISQTPGGYAQNAISVHDYGRRVAATGLATTRGIALTDDDRVRAAVIERLMCDFTFSSRALADRFGDTARPVIHAARDLVGADIDGLVEPLEDGFRITSKGRPLVRTICAAFDSYLSTSRGRHAPAV